MDDLKREKLIVWMDWLIETKKNENLSYYKYIKVRSPIIIFSIWLETVLAYSDEQKCKRPNLN